jgi:uncharacterized Zn-finger protein
MLANDPYTKSRVYNNTAAASPYYPHYDYSHIRRSSTHTSRSSSPVETVSSRGSRSPSPVSKRYGCELCSKRFTRPSSLTTHMYSHTGEVKFLSLFSRIPVIDLCIFRNLSSVKLKIVVVTFQ